MGSCFGIEITDSIWCICIWSVYITTDFFPYYFWLVFDYIESMIHMHRYTDEWIHFDTILFFMCIQSNRIETNENNNSKYNGHKH